MQVLAIAAPYSGSDQTGYRTLVQRFARDRFGPAPVRVHIDRSGKGWLRYVPFKEYVAYPQHAFFNAKGAPVRRLAGYPAT